MSNFFLGQMGLFGFNFNPRGWALAAGQIIPIAQNTALFSLLGTSYGGNGQSTFGLPDMRGRIPLHFGTLSGIPYSLGELAGTENVTLLVTEMPNHKHAISATDTNGTLSLASGHLFAKGETGKPATPTATNFYAQALPNIIMNPGSLSIYGGNQPHNNIQPTLAINYCIATTGIFPSRN
jgi:microcystin-dependent protein